MTKNEVIMKSKSFRELSELCHGPANAWHLIKAELSEVTELLINCRERLDDADESDDLWVRVNQYLAK